jgi:hypothetical protein
VFGLVKATQVVPTQTVASDVSQYVASQIATSNGVAISAGIGLAVALSAIRTFCCSCKNSYQNMKQSLTVFSIQASCPFGWTTLGRWCYLRTEIVETAEAGDTRCAGFDAHLPIFADSAEMFGYIATL